ncbi:unnamed protein product [Ranitomeya imitator]|uniref:Anaphase-promoting complex subunit 4-like WD40 domain-containing protein n=1 Tax=Ranitomeya imitator TaxID=111125 RepID=A0ABN9KUD6_9NEOB|nr:unnamed protein product [Ranitomeya imitator]
MSRRRLEEAVLRSKELESAGESVDEGSEDDEWWQIRRAVRQAPDPSEQGFARYLQSPILAQRKAARRRVWERRNPEQENEIHALDFSTDGTMFATAGRDRNIRIYDSQTNEVWDKRMAKEARRVIIGPHICGPGIDIRNDQILSGSWVARNALQLWDLRSSSLIQDLVFPAPVLQGEFLYAARFLH